MFLEVKDKDNWNLLLKKIQDKTGFKYSDYSTSFLQRRIEVRLRATNLLSFMEYARLLDNVDEQQKLMKEMTIHVTNFFRDYSFWEYFMANVIPEIIKVKKASGNKSIRIWSAGCSTGEEATSIAICFIKKLGIEMKNFDIKIIGTDYDAVTVDRAKKAVYEDAQFREMPVDYKNEFFNKAGIDYVTKDYIKSMIEFKQGDILLPGKPANSDIIFCRNTVIYFETEVKSNLYVDLYKILNNKGFFIMGKTETLNGPAREMFKVFDARERIYKKDE